MRRMVFSLIQGFLLIAITGFVSAHANTLLILGDSLSSGHRMRVEQSWPELLKGKLPHMKIINASSSGETSSGGARRLSILLKQYHPQWCLLELGGNDGLQGLPTALLRQQLTKIIKESQRAKCRVILTEIKLPPNYGSRYTNEFNQVYHHLASQFKIPLMPFFVEAIYKRAGMMQDDGIHPSAKAQPIIATHVAKFINQLIKKETSQKP